MAIAGIPEIINNFNAYLAGRQMPGGITGEVKTPDFESMVSSTSGVGILGEYDAIAIGHYSSMVQEIPFRCINEDYWKLVNPAVPVESLRFGGRFSTANGLRKERGKWVCALFTGGVARRLSSER